MYCCLEGRFHSFRNFYKSLDEADFLLQLLALRLAVIVCHARRTPNTGELLICRTTQGFDLQVSARWQSAYPQSIHLLQEEILTWQKTGITLRLKIHG
jgi:exopolyphosphatase / guanosine-5'-triphosphate,3'-diphosphate pyrophosphatase